MREDIVLDNYLEKVVSSLEKKSPKEILSYAIFNEEEEAKYYAELSKKAKRGSIKLLFIQMSEESEEHRNRLYTLFKKLYPNDEPVKVEAPPIEVLPFYSEFETVDDYLKALEYCMESELFAKKAYELLAQKAEDEDVKALALQLALFEEGHYERIKKAYELFTAVKQGSIDLTGLSPMGYLFSDKIKARYLFLELLNDLKGVIFSRDSPEEIKRWMKKEIISFWITSKTCQQCITPRKLLESLEDIPKEENLAILIENIETLRIAADSFEEFYTNISKLKDEATAKKCYVILCGNKRAFEDKEWAILESEFKYVS
jgi:rubrerythrin